MAAPKYAQRKDDNQAEIVAALEAIGCTVKVMHVPADLLVGFRGRTMIFEVKDGEKSASRRKLTPDQVIFVADWRGQYDVVATVDEAIAAVQKNTLTR